MTDLGFHDNQSPPTNYTKQIFPGFHSKRIPLPCQTVWFVYLKYGKIFKNLRVTESEVEWPLKTSHFWLSNVSRFLYGRFLKLDKQMTYKGIKYPESRLYFQRLPLTEANFLCSLECEISVTGFFHNQKNEHSKLSNFLRAPSDFIMQNNAILPK